MNSHEKEDGKMVYGVMWALWIEIVATIVIFGIIKLWG